MKNKLSIFILILIITLPQVASAAWWNPFSWKVFSRSKPSIEKIEQVLTEEESSSTPNEVSEIEKLKAEIESLKNQKTEQTPSKNTSKENKTTPVAPQTKNANVNLNTTTTFSDVINKYTQFQSVITSERSGLKKNSTLSTEKAYFNYLDDILNKINSDLGYLESVKYWNPRPAGIETTYLDKFNKIKADYDLRAKGYRSDFEEERASVAQQNIETWKQQESVKAQTETDAKNLAKQEKLKSINKQIADLNAKHAADMKECSSGGKTTAGVTACQNFINTTYTNDYNTLQAEWQQVYYSD